MRIAIVSNPALGHINPLMCIAKALEEKGSLVTIYIPGIKNKFLRKLLNVPEFNIPDKLSQTGIPFKILPIDLKQAYLGITIKNKVGLAEVLHALKLFLSGSEKYSDCLKRYFESEKPDIIIYDYTFFAAIAISEILKIKRVAVYHSGLPFLEYPIPPIGSDFLYDKFSIEDFKNFSDKVLREEEKVKKCLQKIIKSEIDICSLTAPSSQDLNIITNHEIAEYKRKFYKNTYYIGPCLNYSYLKTSKSLEDHGDDKPIYISMGTVFNNNHNLYIKLIDACTNLSYPIIVSAGKSYTKLKRHYSDNNIQIFESVNQPDVLSKCSLFLTHGGKNSICESLYFGVPMIVFPFAGEQIYNGNLIEFLGFGKQIKIESITEDLLEKEIKSILSDSDVINKLKTVSELFKSKNGASEAAELITKLQTH